MNIHCLTIPNDDIRARKGFTGADWWFDEQGDLQVRVAKMSSWDREMALAVHEIVEAILAKSHRVTVQQVDEFDAANEGDDHGLNAGDMAGCPYYREHQAATACERVVAMELQIGDWGSYDEELARL
jgi:hypothetical protein